jgi:hypothetical protein
MDDFEQQLESAGDRAEAWIPENDGPLIVGHIVSFGEFDAGYGPYPIVTIRREDGSERAVHCQREVLVDELAKVAPTLGERIGIKWLGKPEGKEYHRYLVRVDRPANASPDWSRYSQHADAPPSMAAPAARPAPPATAPAPAALPAQAPPAPAQSDEDIPF